MTQFNNKNGTYFYFVPNKLHFHNKLSLVVMVMYSILLTDHFMFVMAFHFVLLCRSAAAPPGLNTRRSSSFCLVGSHKITLASLGHSKFPLDKVMVFIVFAEKGCSHWHLQEVNTRLSYSGQKLCKLLKCVLNSVEEGRIVGQSNNKSKTN